MAPVVEKVRRRVRRRSPRDCITTARQSDIMNRIESNRIEEEGRRRLGFGIGLSFSFIYFFIIVFSFVLSSLLEIAFVFYRWAGLSLSHPFPDSDLSLFLLEVKVGEERARERERACGTLTLTRTDRRSRSVRSPCRSPLQGWWRQPGAPSTPRPRKTYVPYSVSFLPSFLACFFLP